MRWRMRRAAGEALLKINAPSARPYLRRALRDSFEIVRGYAARALTNIGDSADIALLVPYLNDRSQIVRYQIQLALQKRGLDSIGLPFADALVASTSGFAPELLYPLASSLKDSAARARL